MNEPEKQMGADEPPEEQTPEALIAAREAEREAVRRFAFRHAGISLPGDPPDPEVVAARDLQRRR